ncbi:MAG: glycosidase, partial [Lachnospiraceae bacterium]|nr:glycosidase [Lachnospiraceae bacterium]
MAKIIGRDLPGMPWQEPGNAEKLPVWRYHANPIIERFATKNSNSIFNSAVVPFEDGYAGVFRCDSKSISMDIFAGFSKDGIHWDISDEPIAFQGAHPEVAKRDFRYDPRVCLI